jgi:myo-inositol-1(or 4)-monophosphatase
MISSGKRIKQFAGKVDDIGVTKKFLTEEDIRIERGFKEIIQKYDPGHRFFAEEENSEFFSADDVWVADPISGTHNFIEGKPHYTIVISHLINHKAVFGAVYDPSVDELFTAELGKGAFKNGQPVRVSAGNTGKIILRGSMVWQKPEVIERMDSYLSGCEIEYNKYSIAANHCWIAEGRFDGLAEFTKDAFPEFAGGLIIREAGGKFTNLDGRADILPEDRIFIGGNDASYEMLLPLVRTATKL